MTRLYHNGQPESVQQRDQRRRRDKAAIADWLYQRQLDAYDRRSNQTQFTGKALATFQQRTQ